MNNSVSTLKKASFLKWFVIFLIGVSLSLLLPYSLIAATMDDYCIVPPFVVGGGMKSNLLLTIDNSGSMYDLQYIDDGKQDSTGSFTRQPSYCYDQTYKSKVCSNDRVQGCTVDADCSAGGECKKNVYAGYFDFGRCSVTTSMTCVENSDCPAEPVAETCNEVIYSYDSGDKRFEPGAAFPVACTNSKGQDTLITNTLCVNIIAGPPKSVNKFIAKGNYLNWLTASKFDVEKRVLTGGKYNTDTKNLIAETRGCVGRRFFKAPLNADFINYNDGEADPNIPNQLELTFAVNGHGPVNDSNPTAPSNGGPTYIEIFEGKSGAWSELCQDAAACFVEPLCSFPNTQAKVEACITGEGGGPQGVCTHNPNAPAPKCTVDSDCPLWKNKASKCSISGNSCAFQADCAVGEICSFPTGNPAKDLDSCTTVAHEANTYIHTIQTCWSFKKTGAPIGVGDAERTENDCYQIYQDYQIGTCNLDPATLCDSDTDCAIGDVCNNGPRAILPANPGYVCNISYAGAYYTGEPLGWTNDWTSTADVIVAMEKFCNENELPPVIDPTEDPSDTSQTFNLPAILSDIAAEGQLGATIGGKFTVKVDRSANPDPTGLIQEFSNRIRFGAMSFNFNGTDSECAVAMAGQPNPPIPCPKVCSDHHYLDCALAADCPDYKVDGTGETCILTTGLPEQNRDGGKIIHYIGTPWKCSVNTGASCSEDFQCPDFETGETCNTVGDHVKGTCSVTAATSCSYDYECPSGETCTRTLVHTIDSIRGDAWTPFAEAFLEAIGYYAKETAEAHDPDPLIYGTSRTEDSGIPLRLNAPDYVTNKNPSQYRCQANNILLVSDGMSTADQNFNLTPFVDSYNDGDGLTGSGVGGCPKYSGSRDLDDLAWLAQHRTITDFNQAADDPAVPESWYLYKKIRTYTVYNGASSNDPDECNPETLLQEAADNGNGIYARAEDPAELEKALRNIFLDVSGKASSGTAASVLASGEESGANLLQAVFYPSRLFEDDSTIAWTGTLQNLWYYIHPLFTASAIREDTNQDGILNLTNDYTISFYFDQPSQTTKIARFDGDGNHVAPDIAVEGLLNIWEAGKILWQRNVKAGGNPRNIKTYTGETGLDGKPAFKNFSTANRTDLKPYLQAASDAESEAVIRYIHGEDTVCSITTTTACSQDADCPGGETCGGFSPIIDIDGNGIADISPAYRKRTVGIDLNGDDDTVDLGENNVWKLGDIISSTPKVVSWVPLNTYDLRYSDTSYANFSCRKTRDTAACTTGYDERGTVFTGANDGMLHAFKLGLLQVESDPSGPVVAKIINPATGLPCVPSDVNKCGEEIWSFIPKHVLPYLKYNADTGYCHIYNVDGIPYVFDASIGGDAGVLRPANGTSWKTVLIGSMKYGGACRKADAVCTNCVKTPGVDLNGDGDTVDIVDGNDESKLGLSSYFALDITDTNPDNWKLLWEFSDENIPADELYSGGVFDGGLGFSTANQAIVRIDPSVCAAGAGKCNGEWFVLIPSGPTGPIDTDSKQFMGRSDQKLKVFVLDLRTGTLQRTIKNFGGSEITNAFGGSILRTTLDPDLDYEDDAVFLGYTRSSTGVGDSWTEGGVLAIMTKEDPDTANWASRKIIEGIGPVTSSIDKLQNTETDKLWLYFGTGRYFYKDLGVIDDSTGARKIYGIKDPCYLSSARSQDADKSFDLTCFDTVSSADLDDVTNAPDNAEDSEGWLINLEAKNDPDAGYDAERVISDPVASVIGVTFFTTFKPSADVCGFGGRSHLWAVKAETGGTATSLLRGKALMQVSTGSIEEVDLKEAFKESATNPDSHDDRRTGAITGKPPEGPGLILLIAPAPREKAIHMREK